ncbi:ABC transporter permease subunit [Rhodobacteraceae bacterium D3-12]|nr:ABC transporter permease subunit [Rhodobacteraceae bacterium D3-12]
MNRRLRDILLQISFVGLLLVLIVGFLLNAYFNLKEQGITSGFYFLERQIGWDMGFAFMPTAISDPYWYALLLALMNTVVIGYAAIALATILGVGVAAMRISGSSVLNTIAVGYIELIRNVPPLVQILAWYAVFTAFPPPRQALEFLGGVLLTARGLHVPAPNVSGMAIVLSCLVALICIAGLLWIALGKRFMFHQSLQKLKISAIVMAGSLVLICAIMAVLRLPDTPLISYPALKGFNISGGITMPPELTTILVGVTVFGSAFAAEIIRGGFLSVDTSKLEAGKALGMTGWSIFMKIRLPIAIRNIIPMMTNLYVWLIKATALGVAVGFADLFNVVVSAIVQSGHVIEFVIILAGAFWAVNAGFTILMNRFDRRLHAKEARK